VKSLRPIVDAFRRPQLKPTVILIASSLLLLAWKYGCSEAFYANHFGSTLGPVDVGAAVYHFVGCFVLLGIVPVLVVKFGFRERLCDYGVRLGIGRRTLVTFLCFTPIFALAAWWSSDDPDILQKFPINPRAGQSPAMFTMHAVTYLLYYVGWEFYFRGFMLFGLRQSLGDVNAVLIQTMASALLHIGSPASETFGAIFAGLLWGTLAIRTRSVLSGLGQHFVLGITLDAFICFG
jgi:membrane protease YdiL (CAAX protease family)